MNNLNYIGSIVRILETPSITWMKNGVYLTKFRVQLPQPHKNNPTTIITIVINGYLANEIVKYYRVNDYILIEGYLSLRTSKLKDLKKNSKSVQINVRKVFPFFLPD